MDYYSFPTKTVGRTPMKMADLKSRDNGLLLVASQAHNYYDDSDENFLYFNPENGSLEFGQWTTRGYCGDNFYDRPSILDADEDTKAKAAVAIRRYLKEKATPVSFTDLWWFSTEIELYGIDIVVNGGRKFKGSGVLLKAYESEDYYGTNKNVSILAEGKIHYANPKFVRFDQQLLLDRMYGYVDELDFTKTYLLLKQVFDNKYYNTTTEVLKGILPLAKVYVPEAPLAVKRESLRKWVSAHFEDYSDEEQERITHRIMLKKYGEDV